MNRMTNEPQTFAEARARLDEILTEVRQRDISLEKSLDLYEEAVRLGSMCADLVDRANYSAEEAAAFDSGDGTETTDHMDDGDAADSGETAGADSAEPGLATGSEAPEGDEEAAADEGSLSDDEAAFADGAGTFGDADGYPSESDPTAEIDPVPAAEDLSPDMGTDAEA